MSKINDAAENAKETAAEAINETAAEKQENTKESAPAKSDSAKKPRKNPFKNKKLKYGGLSILFTVIFIVAVVLVNVIITLLGDRFMPAADLTDSGLYSIEQSTVDYIKTITDEVTITVTSEESAFTGGSSYYYQTNEILKKIAAANSNITLQYIDVVSNPGFIANYTETITSNEIMVESKNTKRVKVLTYEDFLSITYNQQYLNYYGVKQPEKIEANAEQAVVSAIMNVTDTDPVKVAVLTGYGETENTVLQNLLKTNSYVIESVNITLTDKISEDYDFVFMFGPDKDYSVADISKLDTWLDNSGNFGKNLVYVSNPKLGESPNLDGLLDQWGLKVEKGITYQTDENYTYSGMNTYQVLSVPDTDFSKFTNNSPVHGYNMSAVTSKWENQSGNGNISIQSLLKTYDGAVIKPQDSGDNWTPESDAKRTQYSVIMQAVKTRFEGTTPFSSRIVAVGGIEFLNSSFLQTASVNNSQLIMNIFNVSCNKEEGITLTPKSYNTSTFKITDAQKNGLVVGFVIVLPVLLIVFGIIIWVRRLHR